MENRKKLSEFTDKEIVLECAKRGLTYSKASDGNITCYREYE